MAPVIFQTLPEFLSFLVAVLLLQTSAILLSTGRRFLKQASFVAAGISGAAIGEKAALSLFPSFALFAICGGLIAGLMLCQYFRPIAVGVSLAYLTFFSSTYLVSMQNAQWIAALVLFAYGLLLTEVAPTFISNLLASVILVLAGIWVGIPISFLFAAVFAIGGIRVLLTVLSSKEQGRPFSAKPTSLRVSN